MSVSEYGYPIEPVNQPLLNEWEQSACNPQYLFSGPHINYLSITRLGLDPNAGSHTGLVGVIRISKNPSQSKMTIPLCVHYAPIVLSSTQYTQDLKITASLLAMTKPEITAATLQKPYSSVLARRFHEQLFPLVALRNTFTLHHIFKTYMKTPSYLKFISEISSLFQNNTERSVGYNAQVAMRDGLLSLEIVTSHTNEAEKSNYNRGPHRAMAFVGQVTAQQRTRDKYPFQYAIAPYPLHTFVHDFTLQSAMNNLSDE